MADSIKSITDVLGVAGSITTVISLAALSLIAAYLLASQWLRGQRSAAKAAIDKSDDEALARLLGGTKVPLDALTPDQKFSLATEELRIRSRNRIVSLSLIFFAFLALLGFGLMLTVFSPKDEQKVVNVDPIRALDILSLVPLKDRAAACAKLLSEAECKRAEPLLRSLQYQPPTPAQSEIVEAAIKRGGVTASDVQELEACGGAYNFAVRDNRLFCSDGSPIPFIGADPARIELVARTAIVFHASATPENSFAGVAKFAVQGRENLPGPLAHLLISRSGAIVQSAPFNARALHVGRSEPWNGVSVTNSNSIGIEMINSLAGNQQPYTPQQIAAAKGVARAIVQAYGIRVIVGHADVSPGRKVDPGSLFPMEDVRRAALASGA